MRTKKNVGKHIPKFRWAQKKEETEIGTKCLDYAEAVG